MKNKELAVIVHKVQRDKDTYFEKLFSEMWETIYFLSLKMMGNESDAEDVAQEILVKIYNNIDALESPEAFNRWMNRIVMNTCNRELSKRSKKLQNIDNDIGELCNFIEEDNTEFLPAALVDSKETRAIIESLVQELPGKQRQAVLLHYYEELTAEQIASILDCTPSVIHNRLYYAKIALRLKIEGLQKEQDIKLYSVSAIPVLTIILKACAKDACTNSIRDNLWNGVVDSIGALIVSTSSATSATKGVKPNTVTSIVGTSTVSQIVVAIVTVILAISSIFLATQIVNQTASNDDMIQSDVVKDDTIEEQSDEITEEQSETLPPEDESSKEPDQTKEDILPPNETITINPQNPNINDTETIIQGTKTTTISTVNSKMQVPAGSIITNNNGDKTYVSRLGNVDSIGNVTSKGARVTIPKDIVSQITTDEYGNKVLPSGSVITNPDGTTILYPANLVVNQESNSIKKLPLEVDLKSGDVVITENDNTLIITQNGNDTIVDKDTVLNIVNTGDIEGTVVVDGSEVKFDNIDGNLKVIHSGISTVTQDVKRIIETTDGGKTIIEGSVGGNVKTDSEGSTTSIGEGVNGEIKDTNGGKSNIIESNPNQTLPTRNTANIETLFLMLLANLLALGSVVALIIKKMTEEKKMRAINKIKRVSLLSLSFLLIGTLAVPKVFAQENEIVTPEAIETTLTAEETIPQDDVLSKETIEETNTSDKNKSITPRRMGVLPLVDTIEGVETLVADVTTLEEAFPDENFRTYVAVTVLGKTGYNDTTDSGTTLTAANINTIKTRSAVINVASKNIASLEGIQHFVNITSLQCQSNNLTELSISGLTKLTTLYYFSNQVSELDVSTLTNLKDLRCYNNQIRTLDVSNLTQLTSLHCNNNQISELNVSNLTKLTTLRCYDNKISELDVLNLTELTILQCYNNSIIELNVSGLTKLSSFLCYNNQLSKLDVSNLTELTDLRCYNNNIKELDVSKLTKLITLHCHNNQISELDISKLTNLKDLRCNNNQISKLDVSNLTELTALQCFSNLISELDVSKLDNLTNLQLYINPISELNVSDVAKSKITILYYRNTNIDNLDLSGFTALTTLNATKSTNADLSKLTTLYLSGSRRANDAYLVRLSGSRGAFSWDTTTGYYVIAPDMNAKYGFNVPHEGYSSGFAVTTSQQEISLPNGGLMDAEGNLIVGVTLANVAEDGTITLPNGGTIVSAEGTYIFTDSVSIKDGIITTKENFTFTKNTATYNPETGTSTVNVDAISTSIEVGNGAVMVSTIGSDMTIPSGTVVTNNAGDKTYLTKEGIVGSEGNITSNGISVTVPADKIAEIITDENGNIILPSDSIITNADGSTVVSTGSIVIGTDGSVLNVKEVVNSLFNEDKKDVANGITQDQIDRAQKAVNLLADGEEKTALQVAIDLAQTLLNNRNDAISKVEGLLKPGVDQEKIDEAQRAVDVLPNGQIKDTLQIIIDTVQNALDNALHTDKANELLELISTLDRSLYTLDSLAKLDEAVQRLLLDETYLTQTTLDEAIANLQAAYDGLVLLSTDTNGNTNTPNPSITPDTSTNIQAGATNTGDETNSQSLIFMAFINMGLLGGCVVTLRKRKQQ